MRRPGCTRAASACRALGLSLALSMATAGVARGQGDAGGGARASSQPGATIADYFERLEESGLVDINTGTKDTLTSELGAAEELLREGALIDAAVALYAIVESPRYLGFEDFVEHQNAQYYLAVALARSGAHGAALDYIEQTLAGGPSTLYFAPAHRLAVDIALETRKPAAVLSRLERVELSEPLPPGVSGERAYLRARIAYDEGRFDEAEGELVQISRKSRLYSSALYLRGVIRTRRGELASAAEALCEIVDTPADDKYTFVIDDRYFTIVDLARLGLGRLAHEAGEYDDAYYHYFQIPDDSDRLPEALFEAAWSMYQKRELGTARDLVSEFLEAFPSTPLAPEARLLAGYVELADCEFDAAQKHYDDLVADLEPVVAELERIRRDPDLRARLYDRALTRWRAEKEAPDERQDETAEDVTDQVLGLLRLDPEYVRLHDAVAGLRRAAGDTPHVVRAWRSLGGRATGTAVAAISDDDPLAADRADAQALLEDVRRLEDEIQRAREELRRGVRAGTLPEDAAAEERARLAALDDEATELARASERAADSADAALGGDEAPGLMSLIRTDLRRARSLDTEARELKEELEGAADELAVESLDRLYRTTRKVLDKAKLGKIDAVIGQKRRLEIEVQDLAAGRFPPELHGQLWEQGLIGDDEEYWPFEGEYWADEYEGWR